MLLVALSILVDDSVYVRVTVFLVFTCPRLLLYGLTSLHITSHLHVLVLLVFVLQVSFSQVFFSQGCDFLLVLVLKVRVLQVQLVQLVQLVQSISYDDVISLPVF